MKRIGILFGMENTFPQALVERINSFEMPEVTAEFVQLGGVRMAEPSRYSVIVDRISHDVPFYRAYLKNAALDGTYIINNPFWWSADDKFFNYALATRLGVAIPRTVILPHKEHPAGTTDRSMRNLQYPLDWAVDLRLRRLPRVPQAVRRRRLARRAQGQHPGRAVRRLRPDAHAVHDAADGGELPRVLPLLRRRPAGRADHAVRSAAAVSRALHQAPARLRPGPAGAGGARCPAAVPRARLRPQHGGVCRRGRHAVRHRLHEPGAGRRRAFRRAGELRLDRGQASPSWPCTRQWRRASRWSCAGTGSSPGSMPPARPPSAIGTP